MDPRDLSFLLVPVSCILWAAGLLSVIFIERKDRIYLPAALILLHSRWLILIVFFIVALVLSVIFPTLSYPFQNTVEFTLFFVYYLCPPFILWFIFSILSGKFLPEQIKIFLCLLMIFQTGEKKKI